MREKGIVKSEIERQKLYGGKRRDVHFSEFGEVSHKERERVHRTEGSVCVGVN